MKNHLVIVSLLTLAAGLNGSCFKSKQKVNPATVNPTVAVTVTSTPLVAPIKYEKRDDGTYWAFYQDKGWKQTGYVQFYNALSDKKMTKLVGPEGRPVYKIGDFVVNESSFKWVAARRKENKKSCCTIS